MIALFTDFGLAGPYTGQVCAVLAQAAPRVPVISLFADAPAARPKPGAYLLAAYAEWFPAGTVFLAVVDPGVGSARPAVIVTAGGRVYVGPDNGLFELVRRRAGAARTWEIAWQPPRLSASFHGRDLFAPVAARLAAGKRPQSLGREVEAADYPLWPDDLAEIVYIDHYGNAMTGWRGRCLPDIARIAVAGKIVAPAANFAAAAEGTAFWYVNANGLIEIAVNRGRADHALGLAVGTPVAVAA